METQLLLDGEGGGIADELVVAQQLEGNPSTRRDERWGRVRAGGDFREGDPPHHQHHHRKSPAMPCPA